MSDINDGPKTRGRSNRNKGRSSRTKFENLPSSDDESVDSEFYSDEDGNMRRLRSQRNALKSNSG